MENNIETIEVRADRLLTFTVNGHTIEHAIINYEPLGKSLGLSEHDALYFYNACTFPDSNNVSEYKIVECENKTLHISKEIFMPALNRLFLHTDMLKLPKVCEECSKYINKSIITNILENKYLNILKNCPK
jgi:hypothetical protein